jgi:hypothetical protein
MDHRRSVASLVLGLIAGIPGGSAAQTPSADPASAVASPKALRSGAYLTAKLLDAEAKAKRKSATVVVTVHGVKMTDPGSVGEKPAKGQGHIHYRLDDNAVVATTATKLSWHELSSGPHAITVTLAGNDHEPLGDPETLRVTVP